MVKTSKLITLDADLSVKLAETNASSLINRLLLEHFDEGDMQNEAILREKIAEKKAEKTILLQKIRHLSLNLDKIIQKKEEKRQENTTNWEKQDRKKQIEEIKLQWKQGLITDEEYWSFYDK